MCDPPLSKCVIMHVLAAPASFGTRSSCHLLHLEKGNGTKSFWRGWRTLEAEVEGGTGVILESIIEAEQFVRLSRVRSSLAANDKDEN
jgi:hypothetical protein